MVLTRTQAADMHSPPKTTQPGPHHGMFQMFRYAMQEVQACCRSARSAAAARQQDPDSEGLMIYSQATIVQTAKISI